MATKAFSEGKDIIAATLPDVGKTVWDSDKTLLDNDKTVWDSDKTLPDNDKTVLEDDSPEAVIKPDGTSIMTEKSINKKVVAENIIIEKGGILFGTYRVEIDAIEEGGMGQVWRVRHLGWNIYLALKRPRAELFRNKQQKEEFTHECETWMDLGLHPHIVSCYYVREIGGVPSIFSEWMDGGSLKHWIRDGRFYEGDEEIVLKRVLDVAIQFERGLHYAHECGLIHQDVKPGNILLTSKGEVKVADFGLAGARSVLAGAAKNAYAPSDTTIRRR
jgi:hypothetical protein